MKRKQVLCVIFQQYGPPAEEEIRSQASIPGIPAEIHLLRDAPGVQQTAVKDYQPVACGFNSCDLIEQLIRALDGTALARTLSPFQPLTGGLRD